MPRATKVGACADGQFGDVKSWVRVAVWCGRSFGAGRSTGRELAASHAVDFVVHDDVSHVDISTAGMDEVVPTDGSAVAVAANENDVHLRLSHLYAGGKGSCATMGGMKGTKIHITGETGSATDAGDNRGIVLLKAKSVDGPDEPFHDNAMTATGTPDMGQFAGTDIFIVIKSHLT